MPVGRLLGPADDRPPEHDLGVLGERRRQPGRHLAVRRGQRRSTCRRWRGSRSFAVGRAALRRHGRTVEASRTTHCSPRSSRLAVAGGVRAGLAPRRRWSPYQKLALEHPGRVRHQWTTGRSLAASAEFVPDGAHYIGVNNTGYQAMIDLAAGDGRRGRPDAFPPRTARLLAVRPAGETAPEPRARADRRGRLRQRRGRGAARTAPSASSPSRSTRPSSTSAGEHHPEQPYSDPRVRGGQRRRPQLLRHLAPRSST